MIKRDNSLISTHVDRR